MQSKKNEMDEIDENEILDEARRSNSSSRTEERKRSTDFFSLSAFC